MNPKSWTLVGSLLALTLGIGLGACGKLHPAPQIGIVNVSPMSVNISDTTTDSNISVTFVNRNGVDAVITSRQESVYNSDGTLNTRYASVPMNFFIAAGVKADTTGATTGAVLQITWPKVDKKNETGLIGKNSTIIFYGVDAYGDGKTFSDSISFNYF